MWCRLFTNLLKRPLFFHTATFIVEASSHTLIFLFIFVNPMNFGALDKPGFKSKQRTGQKIYPDTSSLKKIVFPYIS